MILVPILTWRLWYHLEKSGGKDDNRRYEYHLRVSQDNNEWKELYHRKDARAWQVVQFHSPCLIRYIRIYGSNNTANNSFHIVEVEAHDTIPSKPDGFVDVTVTSENPFPESKTEKEKGLESESKKWRLRIAIFGIAFLLCLAAYSLYSFYGFSGGLVSDLSDSSEIEPPGFGEIEDLRLESERIQGVLGNLESLSLSQLKTEIGRAAEVITKIQEEVINKELYIDRLQHTIEQEYARAREARANADTLSLLTETELRIVEELLSSNAKKEAKKGFWLGILFSIPIGLFTSIVATWIYEKRSNPDQY